MQATIPPHLWILDERPFESAKKQLFGFFDALPKNRRKPFIDVLRLYSHCVEDFIAVREDDGVASGAGHQVCFFEPSLVFEELMAALCAKASELERSGELVAGFLDHQNLSIVGACCNPTMAERAEGV